MPNKVNAGKLLGTDKIMARDDALDRLKAEASKLGANAVIDVRFDSSDIAQSMTEIVAYGTAVIIEKESGKIQPVSLR